MYGPRRAEVFLVAIRLPDWLAIAVMTMPICRSFWPWRKLCAFEPTFRFGIYFDTCQVSLKTLEEQFRSRDRNSQLCHRIDFRVY
jgi:hypothetical protein